MFPRSAWIAALVISSLVVGSVAAFAFIDPAARGPGDPEAPALYGP